MTNPHTPLKQLLEHLQDLAQNALQRWALPDGAQVRLINVSENATYLVEAPCGYKAVLRVHRENYHTRRAIECELAWLDALSHDRVIATPGYYLGHDNQAIQEVHSHALADPRFVVLFAFIEGHAPDESGDLCPGFERLGAIAAQCHNHAITWPKPQPFERLTWDTQSVFGPQATWGNWRDAPGVDAQIQATLNRAEQKIRARLEAYGKAPTRYNLIHADMRLANLLVDAVHTRLIDFDDCGHGWLMYDFAAAISFIEDDPRIPELKAAWLRGYRRVRALPKADEAQIDTLIMLRRMALLAWIGSHIEAPEPQALAPNFAATTARLARHYLA